MTKHSMTGYNHHALFRSLVYVNGVHLKKNVLGQGPFIRFGQKGHTVSFSMTWGRGQGDASP